METEVNFQDSFESPKSRISELAEKAKEQEQSTPFMEPGQKQKKGPGRPKGSSKKAEPKIGQASQAKPDPEAPPPIPTSQVIKPVVNLLSAAGAAYCEDERGRMKPEELENGATALGMVIDKWAPDLINKWGPEIMCGMVFGQYGLRVMAIKKIKTLEEIEKKMSDEKNNFQATASTNIPEALKVQ